ncbi:MAG: HAMP domain-containing histidine kinase [Myxococcales bacterium]|nr:HAMP domain-containing histidine kinase [Myxococcales bacterium]
MDAATARPSQRLAERISRDSEAIIDRWLRLLELESTPVSRQHARIIFAAMIEAVARAPLRVGTAAPLPALLEPALRSLIDQGASDVYSACTGLHSLDLFVAAALREAVVDLGDELSPLDVAACAEALTAASAEISKVLAAIARTSRADELQLYRDDLSRFAHWTSHELKNRIGVASLAASMLENADADERDEIRSLTARLRGALDQLAQTPNELVTIAYGRQLGELSQTPGELAPLVGSVLAELLPFAEHRGVEVSAHELPALTVDTSRMRLILGTLVHNAIKYASPERDDRWVRISAAPVDDGSGCWRLDVRDNGRGIAREHIGRVFEPGFRGNAHQPGQGIGLALARVAARQLGGELTVKSDADCGSTFTLYFTPLHADGPLTPRRSDRAPR